MNEFLHNRPLLVSVKLAHALGSLDEAAILQQLHELLLDSDCKQEGFSWWIPESQDDIRRYLAPWVHSELRFNRYIEKLIHLGYIFYIDLDCQGTYGLTINYSALDELAEFYKQGRGRE